jgi:hypothetical protein
VIPQIINMERRERAFTVAKVVSFVTPSAWASIPFILLNGIVCAIAVKSDREVDELLPIGFVYASLLNLSNILHTVGHVIAEKIVGSPDGAVRVTSMFHVSYHQCNPAVCTKWTHIGRSLGGPLISLLIGCAVFGLVGKTGTAWLVFILAGELSCRCLALASDPKTRWLGNLGRIIGV